MELPEDVVRWVDVHFSDSEKSEALALLRTAEIPAGESVGCRLLRCAVVSSQGSLRRLEVQIEQLRADWGDVIMAAEYKFNGRNFTGSKDYQRIYDFSRPIEEASVTNDQ